MKTSISATAVATISAPVSAAMLDFEARFPGESEARQAVHTVYGGAHLFRAGSAQRLGELARRVMDEYAPDAPTLARAVGLGGSDELVRTVYDRVREKLDHEPVEDFRIDFEDGYGSRPDEEEDGTALTAAQEVAKGMAQGTLPPFIGIRIKPFSRELFDRSARTLDLFLTTLLTETGGALPHNFVVTLPKVVMPEQVTALVELFEAMEDHAGLDAGTLRMELMVETPQAIIDASGRCPLPELVAVGRGRCIGVHFGVYDYTASVSITAQHQLMQHPACDLARQVMQVSLAGTGTFLSDGATNVLPVPVHRPTDEHPQLTPEQIEENRRSVHGAWQLHFRDVRHSLETAFYQGWDLHPAQLVTRYAALYSFFLESLDSGTKRLKNFVEKAAQATLVGDVFDDAATGQGLLNYFLRGLNSGAITREEALATGLTFDELRARSFKLILENRTQLPR